MRVPAPMAGLSGVTVREVAAGRYHTLLLGACGGVWSCGDEQCGSLGHGDEASLATPRRIEALGQVRAVQVAAGFFHSLVLSAAGHVYSFGRGDDGQLGHGDEAEQLLPRRVAALLDTRVCQLSAGSRHSLATDEAGALYAWGRGGNGRLGLGEAAPEKQLVPARVALPAGVRIRQASAGFRHSLLVASDGALYSCGHGEFGRLGHGDEEERWAPTRVAALKDTPVRAAAAGVFHSAVLTKAGALHTFGLNDNGQLGHDDAATRLEPVAVAALAGQEVAEVAAGDNHTVVRLAGGELRAFGENKYGQLGTGEEEDSLLPVEVAVPAAPATAS